jgi:hypothetical protein
MGDETICKCTKEIEIKDMLKDINTLMRLVVEGNGKDPMIVSIPRLADIADKLNTTVNELATGIRGLLQFQSTWEGRMEEKSKADELLRKEQSKYEEKMAKQKRTYQWIITSIIAAFFTVLGILIGTHI